MLAPGPHSTTAESNSEISFAGRCQALLTSNGSGGLLRDRKMSRPAEGTFAAQSARTPFFLMEAECDTDSRKHPASGKRFPVCDVG